MAHRAINVTCKSSDTVRIPDRLIEAASLLLDLPGRSVLKEAGEHVRILRQGGYSGLQRGRGAPMAAPMRRWTSGWSPASCRWCAKH